MTQEMKIIQMPIDDLLPADYNPRVDLQEGDPEFEKLKASIETFGFVQPIVINIRTGNIVGGHQRQKVAKALGYDTVPVTRVDLDDDQEKQLNLILNKVSGAWDEEALGHLLADLQQAGADLDITGFDEIEIEELTMAFTDDLPFDDIEVFGGEEGEYTSEGEERSEGQNEGSEDGAGDSDERGYIIQYNIIFDDEVQQETFHSFLKMLKDDMGTDAFPSHASRIHAFLKRDALPLLNERRQERE